MDVLLQALIYGFTLSSLYIPVALGLNLIFGVLHIINFGQGDLFMLGAIFTWFALTSRGVDFITATFVAIVIVGLIGVLIERILLRPLGHDMLVAMLVTLGLSMVTTTATLLIAGSDVKHYAFPLQGTVNFIGTNLSIERVSITIVGIIAAILFYLLLQQTKIGRAIRAVAQDEEAAMMQGINPGIMRSIVMFLGCVITALGGALAASIFGAEPFMGMGPMLFAFIVMTLGGLGSIEGTLLAGVFLGVAESFITIYIGATEAAMAGFIILYLVIMLRPQGFLGRPRLTGGFL